jgi:type I restriction enzyme M protein
MTLLSSSTHFRHFDEILAKLLEASRNRGGDRPWLPAILLMATWVIESNFSGSPYGEMPHDRMRQPFDVEDFFSRRLRRIADSRIIDRLSALIHSIDERTFRTWLDLVKHLELDGDREVQYAFAKWFGALLDEPEMWSGKGGMGVIVPQSLSRLMASIAEVRPGMRILDPSCGVGGFLAAAVSEVASEQHGHNAREIPIDLVGVDRDDDALAITWLRLYLLDREVLIESGSAEPEQADVILSAPPAGVTLDQAKLHWPGYRSRLGTTSRLLAETVATATALDWLKPQGCAVLLIPKGLLFRSGDDGSLRRRMIEQGEVSAVINLPAGIFAPLTHITTALLVLRKNGKSRANVAMIDAGEAGRRERRRAFLTSEDCAAILQAVRTHKSDRASVHVRSVDVDEIEANDHDLRPERYLARAAKSQARPLEERLASVKELECKYRAAADETDALLEKLLKAPYDAS